ncbi:winged helix-turn-helix domain-containing protein [Rhizobium johnstonii]|uniref:winged helix-turn-helix domain-containing protein n=1 Tax=Rhizobium johnstonii TaxID=3019933 RepID=UPI003F9DE6A9
MTEDEQTEFTLTNASTEVVWSFGDFRLIPKRHLLLHGSTPVKLGGRAFEVLKVLVEKRGEVVSKRELIAAAWPEAFVLEGNLKVTIFSLRKALGDTQAQPGFIATVSGRGYRFVAPVKFTNALVAGGANTLPNVDGIIGRTSDVEDVVARVRNFSVVTICGAGGVGKTRLALAVADCMKDEFPDGICWVDLSTISDPTLVSAVLASALGMGGNPSDPLDAMADYLRPRRILILLDNCEHVLSSLSLFVSRVGLRDACRVLTTSREPIGASGESVLWLEPLRYPIAKIPTNITESLDYPAIVLFSRRASDTAGYILTDEDCAAVGEICRSLDGLPLAIELAASEMQRYNPKQILEMLNARMDGWGQGQIPRHQTLLSVVDWSYQLLSADEATIFCVLWVFAGAFESDDVLSVAKSVGLSAAAVARGLGSLVSKSLLQVVDGSRVRYKLLDITRRYAEYRMVEQSRFAVVSESHALRMIELFERSEDDWNWRERNEWNIRYRDRLPDIRKAIDWAFKSDEHSALAIRLTVAAIPILFEISSISEARAMTERALAHRGCSELQRLKLLSCRAWCMIYARRLETEVDYVWLSVIELASKTGMADYQLRALIGHTFYLLAVGRTMDAVAQLQAFGELADIHPDLPAVVDGERVMALVKAYTGNLGEALTSLDRLALSSPTINPGSKMAGFQVDRYIGTRTYQSFVAWLCGRPRQAVASAEQGVQAAGRLGHSISQSNVLVMAALPISLWNRDLAALSHYTDLLKANFESEPVELWLPALRYFSAAAEALDGRSTARRSLNDAIEQLIDSRFTLRVCGHLGFFAEILTCDGKFDEANEQVARAVTYQRRQQEWWCAAELQRIQGVVWYKAGDAQKGEDLLWRALDEARAVGALGFELRIANSLADIFQQEARDAEIHNLLAPIYKRFEISYRNFDLSRSESILQAAGQASRR